MSLIKILFLFVLLMTIDGSSLEDEVDRSVERIRQGLEALDLIEELTTLIRKLSGTTSVKTRSVNRKKPFTINYIKCEPSRTELNRDSPKITNPSPISLDGYRSSDDEL
jgi:hypothetical protein